MALNDWHKPTERVLSILELLASTPEGITLSQISDKLSIPKGTLFPIIHTLNHHQFISLDKITGKYQIALRTYLIGEAFASHKSAFQFVHDEMHSIVSELEEICQMGILDNGNVLKSRFKRANSLTILCWETITGLYYCFGKSITFRTNQAGNS